MVRCSQHLAGLVATTVMALTTAALAEDLPEPPYAIAGADMLIVGVKWDEAVVRAALPPGVEAVAEMTGGINVYQAERSSPFGGYQSAYFWVDIEGFDNRDGSKGRWMVQGVYGPNPRMHASLKNYYGWPLRLGGSRREKSGDVIRSTGRVGGQDFVTVEMTPGRNCTPSGGTINYAGRIARTGQVVVHEIPFIGEWCPSESVSAKVSGVAGDPFAKFKPVEVLWGGELKNVSVAFVRPIPNP